MYVSKRPESLKPFSKSLIWNMDRTKPVVYLTFDDGPIPTVTPWVLDVLDSFNAKATFFCVGDNVIKYKEVFDELKTRGHGVGNHTMNHLNGWTTNKFSYYKNILKASQSNDSKLFRPPYGKISPNQIMSVKKRFKIVMWDLLTGDFDIKLSPEKCLENALKAKPGSIVVFHDSLKAERNLRYVLPRFLEEMAKRNLTVEKLSL